MLMYACPCMPHLIKTSNTTNMTVAMTTKSIIVAPAATGKTDKPTLKTKSGTYIHSIDVSASTNDCQVIDFTQLPDEEVDSVESDAMYVGDDNVYMYKDDGMVDGLYVEDIGITV